VLEALARVSQNADTRLLDRYVIPAKCHDIVRIRVGLSLQSAERSYEAVRDSVTAEPGGPSNVQCNFQRCAGKAIIE